MSSKTPKEYHRYSCAAIYLHLCVIITYISDPEPPRNLIISNVSNGSLTLKWSPPLHSLFNHYKIRYQTADLSASWKEGTSDVLVR